MKIGTLTYHDTTNYGAVLQAYALQKKINDLGYDCEIIDYKCDAITQRYKIKKLSECKNLKQLVKSILTNRNSKILKNKFKNFEKNYQKLSSKSYYKSDIIDTNRIYDKFVVGSDQVWNLELSGEDATYFLDFVDSDEKKLSYAASFGYSKVPDKYLDITKENLSKFNNILVREEQGKKIVKNLLNRDVEITLDPTLLLNSSDWNNIIDKTNIENINYDYILLYIIAPNNDIIEFARKLAKKKNCKIIYINHSYKNVIGVKNVKTAGPDEFLYYLKNAKYIVTTSFHGVAFSINFKKQFFYALSKETNNFNSRIENLVNLLGLEDRTIDKDFSKYKTINYENVYSKLDEQRTLSQNELRKELVKKYDKK